MSLTLEPIATDAPEEARQASAVQQRGTSDHLANPYKVEIRNSPGWNKFDAVTLGISPLADFWDKEGRLEAVLHFAARKFRKIRIDVSDMLYQHTFLGIGIEAGMAASSAAALGTAWLKKHQATIAACPTKPEGRPEWKPRGEGEWKLETKPEVVRWLAWLRHPDFADVYAGFKRAYTASPVLRSAIDTDIESFHLRTTGCLPSDLQKQHGLKYMMEELTVMTLQGRDLPGLKLYPGDELACFQAVRSHQVPKAPRGLELQQFAHFNIRRRRRDLLPIQFGES